MTLQPPSLLAPDAELWATGYVRDFLANRTEPYALNASVGRTKPNDNRPRFIGVRRDGGLVSGLFDNPRMTFRVWADLDKDASDLARLVIAGLRLAPGSGPVVGVSNIFGPSPIPDSSQPQYAVTAEFRLRCEPL